MQVCLQDLIHNIPNYLNNAVIPSYQTYWFAQEQIVQTIRLLQLQSDQVYTVCQLVSSF